MYVHMDILEAYTFMAKAFEHNDLQIYDVPGHRDKLISKLKSMESSPLGENDDYPDGYEKQYLGSIKIKRKQIDENIGTFI